MSYIPSYETPYDTTSMAKKMCKCCWIVRIGMYFLFRGQLILKCPFGVFKSTKNPTNVFKGNSCSSLWKEDESKKVPNWIISK